MRQLLVIRLTILLPLSENSVHHAHLAEQVVSHLLLFLKKFGEKTHIN